MREFEINPKTDVQRQWIRDMQVPSLHFFFFRQSREPISSWELAHDYQASYCSDPRDRVFALLPLADLASRKMFQPDYTKSVVEIVLQLLRSKAKSDAEDAEDAAAREEHFSIEFNFKTSHDIIGSFGLGPEDPDIAAMLKQRVSALHQDPEVPATRECKGWKEASFWGFLGTFAAVEGDGSCPHTSSEKERGGRLEDRNDSRVALP